MNQLEAIQFIYANMSGEAKYDGPILMLVGDIAKASNKDRTWTGDELQRLLDIEEERHCEQLEYPPGE